MAKIKEIFYMPGSLNEWYIAYESRRDRVYPKESFLPKTAKAFLENARCDKLACYDPPIYKYTNN